MSNTLFPISHPHHHQDETANQQACTSPQLYGMFASLNKRAVLVVGGGEVAERKVTALLKAGARVTVGAPQLTPLLSAWQQSGRIRHLDGAYADEWLNGMWLVVAATDQRWFNRRLAQAANRRRLFINVVDDAALSSFQVPAVVDRGALQIAISTAGAAPVLARQLRSRLETQLHESWGALVDLTARFRHHIKSKLPDLAARRHFFEQLPESPVAACLQRHDSDAAERALLDRLHASCTHPSGEVVLVGAGPGDPGLLTLHAVRALQQADVILHDRLVSADVLALARRDAELICVGKAPGKHAYTQENINTLLVTQAQRGRCVVRLKGGDPFIFGRGGEELQVLRQAGIAYRVVPGITSAAACAAYAGIPLTHREHAQSVRFVTAHCKHSIDTLDWRALAAEKQTLAIYMGVAQLNVIQQQLLQHGCQADLPFALIENGSRAQQRVIRGCLGELAQRARQAAVQSPAMLILGEVAALSDTLAWFHSQASDARTSAHSLEVSPHAERDAQIPVTA